MRYFFLLFCFVTFIVPSYAQFTPYYQTIFFPLQSRTCAGGSVNQPAGWTLYQTLDGTFDGPIDSSICINCSIDSWCKVDLTHVDPSRPLFLRNDPGIFTDLLIPNWLYNYSLDVSTGDCEIMTSGIDCAESLCNGSFLGISIPDSNGVELAATRFHHAVAAPYQISPEFCSLYQQACFPTEKFDLQRMRDVVAKFEFKPDANLAGKHLFLFSMLIEPLVDPFAFCLVDDIPIPQNWFSGNTVSLNIRDVCFNGIGDNVLLRYKDATYPSPEHISYVEAYPSPNTAIPNAINLWVEEYQSLEFQPFTQLIGGLTLGGDSTRHQVTLINDGGDFCFNFFEVVMAQGQQYWHASGILSFNSPQSCMRFEAGSTLRVLDLAQLRYGHDGIGMLAFCSGAEIRLDPGAQMVFDGRLVLSDCGQPAAKPAKITLAEGTSLTFDANAEVISYDESAVVEVYLAGGQIDLSALTEEERGFFRLIYPEYTALWSDALHLQPNPASDHVRVDFSSAMPLSIRLTWRDMNGRVIDLEDREAVKGENEWLIPVPAGLTPGLYAIEFDDAHHRTVKKVAVF